MTNPLWPWPFFTRDEMKCKHTGACNMDPSFMDKLVELRQRANMAMKVTSGYRDPTHPSEAKKPGGPGEHSLGLAADIEIGPGEPVHKLLTIAFALGFSGIGVSQRQGQPRFVHLDTSTKRKAVWSY